ncbi:MAG TPA: nuclear transport factor 2 family protein, partial [bacterium]|nr:nuclear transport factor 2 family protein [bacterium]
DHDGRSSADDEAAIVGTVLDYFEGWFQGDAIRMERALHPELAKRCLGGDQRWWGEGGGKATGPEALVTTTAREMINATAKGVGKERARVVDDLRIQVQVEDIYDTIAAVTVRSAVYREYLHLVRTREGWKIANALWQRT